MILGAGLLVLLGLGLLVAGVVTGVTLLYWGCVAVCIVAAVLLYLVRRQIAAARKAAEPAEPATPEQHARPVEAAARRAAAPVHKVPTEPAPVEAAPAEPVREQPALGATRATASSSGNGAAPDEDEPPLEEVEVTDLLIIVDLHDEVLVVDEHPRYHLAECSYLTGRTTIPLPLDEARSDGFTPCGRCSPDRTLAERARARS